MKFISGIFIAVVVLIGTWLPSETRAADPQNRRWQQKDRSNRQTLWEGRTYGRHRYRGRNRYTYGYKNYGQYRRTQVGNRRYRMVRRWYWDDGRRMSRWVRLYY